MTKATTRSYSTVPNTAHTHPPTHTRHTSTALSHSHYLIPLSLPLCPPHPAAIQLYGALIVGQAILVYTLRSQLFTQRGQSSPFSRQLRQGVCLAYTVVFGLSFCFVVKAQVVGVMNMAASVNSLLFLGLAAAYGILLFRSTSGAPKRMAL